jgi:hypothetical protein
MGGVGVRYVTLCTSGEGGGGQFRNQQRHIKYIIYAASGT